MYCPLADMSRKISANGGAQWLLSPHRKNRFHLVHCSLFSLKNLILPDQLMKKMSQSSLSPGAVGVVSQQNEAFLFNS